MSNQRAQMTVNGAEVTARIEACGFCSRHTIFPIETLEDKLHRELVLKHVATDTGVQRAVVYNLYPCAWCGKFSPDAVTAANEAEVWGWRKDRIRWWKMLAGMAFIALVLWAIVVAGFVQLFSGKPVPILSWIIYPAGAIGTSVGLYYMFRAYRRFLSDGDATVSVAELNDDDRQAYWLQFAADMLALRCDPTGRPVKGSDDPGTARPWKQS